MPPEAGRIEPSEHELREVGGHAVERARGALRIFEQRFPADPRPRDAIDAAHAPRAEESASEDDRRVTTGTLERARHNAPEAVTAALGRLPAAPPGGGRVGECVYDPDAALRAEGRSR